MVSDGGGPELRDDILALVKREIAAEREACAKLIEALGDQFTSGPLGSAQARPMTAIDYAAAIRARGEDKT
jgi:hypothetical protein